MFFAEVLKILFWVFCLIGLFTSLKMLCSYYLLKQGNFKESKMVLFLENDEETIENTIRIMAEEIFFTSREKICSELTVVDIKSHDSSRDIIKLLKKEYPFLRFISKEEYIEEIGKL